MFTPISSIDAVWLALSSAAGIRSQGKEVSSNEAKPRAQSKDEEVPNSEPDIRLEIRKEVDFRAASC